MQKVCLPGIVVMATDMWWRGIVEMAVEGRGVATQGTKTLTWGFLHFFSEVKEVNQIVGSKLIVSLLLEVENKCQLSKTLRAHTLGLWSFLVTSIIWIPILCVTNEKEFMMAAFSTVWWWSQLEKATQWRSMFFKANSVLKDGLRDFCWISSRQVGCVKVVLVDELPLKVCLNWFQRDKLIALFSVKNALINSTNKTFFWWQIPVRNAACG